MADRKSLDGFVDISYITVLPPFFILNNGTATPTLGLNTIPTSLGGTGITVVGATGQVLTSDGTNLFWNTPTGGTVTSVSASTPLSSTGGTTPNISISSAIPTTLGGTGLTTLGSSGQVLTSNGTAIFWDTPTGGTTTSVTASSPLASSGGTTPNISIPLTTGSGSTVVLQSSPSIATPVITGSIEASAGVGTLKVDGGIYTASNIYIEGDRNVTGRTTIGCNTFAQPILTATSPTVLVGAATLYIPNIPSPGANVTLNPLASYCLQTDGPILIGSTGISEFAGGLIIAGGAEMAGIFNLTGTLNFVGGTIGTSVLVTGTLTAVQLVSGALSSLTTLQIYTGLIAPPVSTLGISIQASANLSLYTVSGNIVINPATYIQMYTGLTPPIVATAGISIQAANSLDLAAVLGPLNIITDDAALGRLTIKSAATLSICTGTPPISVPLLAIAIQAENTLSMGAVLGGVQLFTDDVTIAGLIEIHSASLIKMFTAVYSGPTLVPFDIGVIADNHLYLSGLSTVIYTTATAPAFFAGDIIIASEDNMKLSSAVGSLSIFTQDPAAGSLYLKSVFTLGIFTTALPPTIGFLGISIIAEGTLTLSALTNVSITSTTALSLTATGVGSFSSTGAMTVSSAAATTVSATADLTLTGGGASELTAAGDLTLTGGAAAELTAAGDLTLTGGAAAELTAVGALTLTGGTLFITGGATQITCGAIDLTVGAITALTPVDFIMGADQFGVTTGAGAIDLTTGGGAMTFTVGAGAMLLTTGAGDLSLTTATGLLTLTCGAGLMSILTLAGGILMHCIGGGIEISTTVGGVKVTCGTGDSELSSAVGACYIYAPVGGINVGDSGHQNGHFIVYCTNGATAPGTGNVEFYTSTTGLNLGPGDFIIDTSAALVGNLNLKLKGAIHFNNITINNGGGSYSYILPANVGNSGSILLSGGSVGQQTWLPPAATGDILTLATFTLPITSAVSLFFFTKFSVSGGITSFPIGTTVTLAGFTPSSYNGTYTIFGADATTVTIAITFVSISVYGTISSTGPVWTVPGAGTGTVTAVTASSPLSSSGGATPNISVTGGTNGQVLSWVSGSPAWATPSAPGTGTVTSVALTAPADFTITGSPITTSGTLAISFTTPPTGSGAFVQTNTPTITTPVFLGSTSSTTIGTINLVDTNSTPNCLLSLFGPIATSATTEFITLGVSANTYLSAKIAFLSNVVVSPLATVNFLALGLYGGAAVTIDGTGNLIAPSIKISGLTASSAVATDAAKNLVSVATTGTGSYVLATSPVLTSPNIDSATGTSLTLSAGPGGILFAETINNTNVAFGSGAGIVLQNGTLQSVRIYEQNINAFVNVLNFDLTTQNSTYTTGISIQNNNFTSTLTTVITGTCNITGLTASSAVATDASKNLVSVATTGTGSYVLATSPVLTTPNVGAATGLSYIFTNTGNFGSNNVLTNANNGTLAYAGITLNNDNSSAVWFLNSSTRTTDGIANMMTLRNNAGPLRLSTALAACTLILSTSTATLTGTFNVSTLTASSAVATDASKNLVSVTTVGTGSYVLATSPTLVTPNIGAASATSLTTTAFVEIGTGATGSYGNRRITSDSNYTTILSANAGAVASFVFTNGTAATHYVTINGSYMIDVTGTARVTGILNLGGKDVGVVPTCAGSMYTGSGTTWAGGSTVTVGNWTGVNNVGGFDLSYNSGTGQFVNSTGRTVMASISWSDSITDISSTLSYIQIIKNTSTLQGVQQCINSGARTCVSATVILANTEYFFLQASTSTGGSGTASNAVLTYSLQQI